MLRVVICILFLIAATHAVDAEQATAIQTAQDLLEMIRRQGEEIEKLKQMVQKQGAELEELRRAVAERNRPPAPAPAGQVGAQPSAANRHESATVGRGRAQFDGLLQAWFVGQGATGPETFRIRRAQLRFSGQIVPRVNWNIMIDPAKELSIGRVPVLLPDGTPVLSDVSINQASRVLQDSFITLDISESFHLDVGQYKIPLSREGLQSTATLETVERAMFLTQRARGGTFGNIRDIGIQARGQHNWADFRIGLFNSSGDLQNTVDENDRKTLVGRLVLAPPGLGGLELGFSGARGTATPARIRRDRLGAELFLARGPLSIKSEVMSGRDGPIHRIGWYGHIGYRFGSRFELVFRQDNWDPDTDDEASPQTATERNWLVGLNYFIDEHHAKFQINYIRRTFAGPFESRNLLLINLQTAW